MSQQSIIFLQNLSTMFLEMMTSQNYPSDATLQNTALSLDNLLSKMTINSTPFPSPPLNGGMFPVSQNKSFPGTEYIGQNQMNSICNGCSWIFKSGQKKGQACGAKVKPGYDVCNTHLPKDIKEETKKNKAAPPAQSIMPTTGNFNFKAGIPPVINSSVESNTNVFNPGPLSLTNKISSTSFTTRFNIQRKAPEFFERQFNGDMFLFCGDELVSNLVFHNEETGRACVGLIMDGTKINELPEPLPDSFGEKVQSPSQMTEDQKKWCVDNQIQIVV